MRNFAPSNKTSRDMILIALKFPTSIPNEYENRVWYYSGQDDLRTKIKYTPHKSKATDFPSVERAKSFAENLIKKHFQTPKFWVETDDKTIKIN